MKKFLKRTLAVFLAVVMTFGAAPLSGFVGLGLPETSKFFTTKAEAAEEYTSGDYTYTVDEDNCATITKYASDTNGEVSIPATLGGSFVKTIGKKAFYNNNKITSISMPDSITVIEDSAFNKCSSLSNIKLSDKLISIGSSAFSRCENLTEVKIPKTVKTIDSHAFYECTKITEFSVPTGNEYFSNDDYGVLFDKNKTSLIQYPVGKEDETYDIPKSVLKICAGAFAGCCSIRDVNIPDSVTEIESGVFSDTYYSNMYYWENPEELYIDKHLIYAVPSSSPYKIKSGTKTIAAGALSAGLVIKISTIVIPDSVVSIGYNAFSQCENLTNITIGNNVKSIGENAFDGCTLLKTVNGAANVEHIGENAFEENCPYITDESNYIDGVMYIGKHLYKAKTTVSGAYKIKDGTVEIGDSAFWKCKKITGISIPDTVRSIGRSAFRETNLTELIIPDGVKTIPDSMSMNCHKLIKVSLPESVIKIGEYAFSSCEKLSDIKIPLNTEIIEKAAFGGCEALKAITIPDKVTSIGEIAFDSCYSITEVNIPDGVMFIGERAFESCSELSFVSIGKGITKIPSKMFAECKKINCIVFRGEITSIGKGAFNLCEALSAVYLPESLIEIGDTAFSGCYNLGELHIPASVKNIGEHMFDGSSGFICSDSFDNYAYEYAVANNYSFKICGNEHPKFSLLSYKETYSVANSSDNFNYMGHKNYWISDTDFQKLAQYTKSLYADSKYRINALQKYRQEDWSGSCYGMAVTTILDKTKQIGINENFSYNYSLYEIDKFYEKLISAINYYHISQNTIIGREWHSCYDSNWSTTLKNLVSQINSGKLILFSYWWNEFNSAKNCYEEYGHSVVIKGYKEANGEHILVAYDNRYPGHDFEIIIDKDFVSMITENGEEPHTISYKTDFEIYDVIDIDGPNNDMQVTYSSAPNKNFEGLEFIFPASGEVDIKNSEGKTLNYKNGKLSGSMSVISKGLTSNSNADGSPAVADIIVVVPESDSYTIETSENTIDISARSDKVYASANVTDADSVIINTNTGIKVNGNNHKDCELYLSSSDNLGDMVSIKTYNGNDAELKYNGDDIILTGVDGVNTTISVYDNIVETNKFSFPKGCKDVLVTSENDEIDIRISSKNNGVYDTSVKPGTSYNPSTPSGTNTCPNCGKVFTSEAEYNAHVGSCEAEPATKPSEPVTEPVKKEDVINAPSTTTITYGDSIILHADVDKVPEGATIEWTADNGNFTYTVSEDGTTCTITPAASGTTTFAVTIVDKNGDVISSDTQTMTAKAGFFQKLIAFFKKLFGMTKVYSEIFKRR